MKHYDVVVVGGGFAGVCAAISAAREGSSVLLVEKGNALGGAAVNSLVIPFMPNATKLDGVMTELSQGLFKTICEKLDEKGAMRGKLFLEEELKFILNDMVREVGVEPKIKPIRGGTDGAQLSFKGLPCPNIFAGGVNFHSRYEFVPVQSMEKAMMTIVKIAEIVGKR